MLRRKIELRKSRGLNIPREVRRSLEILDHVLDEYDDDESIDWRSRSVENVHAKPESHEDVRKSLEILDNVLAEFDDGVGESWTCFAANGELNSHDKELVSNEDKNNAVLRRDNAKSDTSPKFSENSFRHSCIDGTASHDTAPSVAEDDKRFSPPPVPKRNPATRLSSQDDLSACSSFENISSSEAEVPKTNIRAREHRRQILSANENSKPKAKTILTNPDAASSCSLSNQSKNSKLMSKRGSFEGDSMNDNDEVFVSYAKLTLSRSASAHAMATESIQKSPSVASRRALYEKTNLASADDAKRSIDKSNLNGKAHPIPNSPLLRRKFTLANSPVLHKRNVSDSTDLRSSGCKISSMELVLSDANRSQPTINQLPIANNGTSDVNGEPLVYGFSQATKDRIALLDKKFAEVKHLLKTKQIVPLDCEPPRFVPTPPPRKIPRKQYDITKTIDNCDSGVVQSSSSVKDYSSLSKRDIMGLKCPVTLIDTISDISCILPMDTLTRQPLGLSYSMEDDLNPGVKEILASTPKSDKPMLGLSTFSQSVSSLGYSSGQSDLDLTSSLKENSKKIPVTNLKSQTLPTGMKLGPPFSYVADIYSDCDRTDHFEISKSKNISEKILDDTGHFRSSSAPPLKHLQRKNKFGISLKVQNKEKNKKKDDSISLKSDVSVEDGIILRKITTIDGSTEYNDLSGRKQITAGSEEKTKRRSVWKSILRRK